MFKTWLQWFKTAESGVEWPELAIVKKECCQLYKQYKGEEWIQPFDVHFALVDPSLEFLLEDLMVGMIVSALAVASASNTTKPPEVALTDSPSAAEPLWSVEPDIREAEPSIPKIVAGGIVKGLAMLPRVVTTLRSKGKGKSKNKAQEEEEDFEEKSKEVVESNDKEGSKGSDNGDDNNDNVPLAQKQSASLASVASIEQLRTIASKEREKEVEDVEMREKTPLAMIAEAELATSDMEVEGGEEFEAAAIAMEKDTEEDKGEDNKKVQQ
ncbi:hypothetical protein C0989_011870 [Termitomyces sp. Mn162]|nr:hypothetical protein C0989_011870 [Termitomyces sp. Mn162]